jgi:peroxiredoxin
VGVSDAYPDEARKWARQMDMQFSIIPDPEIDVMKAYSVEHSVYAMLISKDGKIVRMWPGYSDKMLQEVNDLVAKELGVKVVPFDPQYAPKEMLSGCKFEARTKR